MRHNIIDVENNRVEWLDDRFYAAENGEFYPSVTTVLSLYPKGQGFIMWLKDLGNNADAVMERAAEAGTKIHHAVEQYVTGQEVTWAGADGKAQYDLSEWQQICRFAEFWKTHKPKLIASEQDVTVDKYRLGGTLDLIVEINGETWLIDVKSSKAMYKTHELQLSAYAMMWNEKIKEKDFRHAMKGTQLKPVDRHAIFHTKALTRGPDKSGKKIQGKGWQLVTFNRPYTEAWKIYEHIHAIYREENPDPKPKNLVYPMTLKK